MNETVLTDSVGLGAEESWVLSVGLTATAFLGGGGMG